MRVVKDEYGKINTYFVWVSTPRFNTYPMPTLGNATTILPTMPEGFDPGSVGWVHAPNIEPLNYQPNVPRGQAQFEIRYLNDDRGQFITDDSPVPQPESDQWIALTIGESVDSTRPDDAQRVKWWGRIRSTEVFSHISKISGRGTILADGPGTVLDTIFPISVRAYKDNNSTPLTLNTRLPYNFTRNDTLVGNYLPVDPSSPDRTGGPGALTGGFALNPRRYVQTERTSIGLQWADIENEGNSDRNNFWTPLRILMHEIGVFNDMPGKGTMGDNFLTLYGTEQNSEESADAGIGDSHTEEYESMLQEIIDKVLGDTNPNTWDLTNMSMGKILDLIFPINKGLSWRIRLGDNQNQWTIMPYTLTDLDVQIGDGDNATVYLPNNPQVPKIDTSQVPISNLVLNSHNPGDRHDRLLLRGSHILCCASFHGPGIDLDADGQTGGATRAADHTLGTLVDGWRVHWPKEGQSSYVPQKEDDIDNLYIAGSVDTNVLYDTIPEREADQVRARSRFANFYTRYRIRDYSRNGTWDGILRTTNKPGEWKEQQVDKVLCPKFTWDPSDNTLTVGSIDLEGDQTEHSTPHPMMAQIQSFIPLSAGYGLNSDGSIDESSLDKVAGPHVDFLPPQLWQLIAVRDEFDNLTDDSRYANRINAPNNWVIPSIKPEDMEAAVRFELSIPLAQAFWDCFKWAIAFNKDEAGQERFPRSSQPFGGTNDAGETADHADWRLYLFTAAVPSSQHVEAEVLNPFLLGDQKLFADVQKPSDDTDMRNARNRAGSTLLIEDPSFQCYYIHENTVVETFGIPDWDRRIQTTNGKGVFTRNDFPQIQRRANEIAAYLFRRRSLAKIELKRPDLIPGADLKAVGGEVPWAVPGIMLGEMNDGVDRKIRSVVQSVTVNLSGDQPTATILTDPPPDIQMGTSIGASSGSGGGFVDPTLGGDLQKTVVKLKHDSDNIKKKMANLPMNRSHVTIDTGPRDFTEIQVGGGNAIEAAGVPALSRTGIKQGFTISSVPSIVPAKVDTHADGLGWGLIAGQSEPVWVAYSATNADGDTFNGQVNTITLTGMDILSSTTIQVPVSGGGTAPVYIMRNN